MNRRAFLGSLAAVAAGLALDPERALWVPNAKRIFLPSVAPVVRTPIALTKGDIFTIAGSYAVNPAGLSVPFLQQFVVTADVTEGPLSMNVIHPAPMTSGPYRNVSWFSGDMTAQPLYCGKTIPTEFSWSEA